MPACSSTSADDVAVTYEQLGDLQVNELTGSGMNGDLLGRGGDGGGVRWRAATSTWEHVGKLLTLAPAYRLYPRCEDAAGTIYAEVINNGIWMLPMGAQDWVPMPLPDSATESGRPFASAKGDLVLQTKRMMPDLTTHLGIYRKPAGSTAWTLASDRILDFYDVVGLADDGDVFLMNKASPDQSPLVLQASATAPVQLANCAGPTIFPYCSASILVNAGGDALFYGGGSRHLYLLKSSPTYPATPELVFDFPDSTCCFNGGEALLADDTVVARMNQGGYDPYFLYVHKPGAASWVQAPPLPQEDGNHSVDIFANTKGELFTSSILLGQTTSTGPAYRVHF